MKRLSAELDVPLLEASPTGIRPTNYGELFLACCDDVTDRLARLHRTLAIEKAHSSNILRVGFVTGSLSYFSETVLREFEHLEEGCSLHAVGRWDEANLANALLLGDVDFAILRHPPGKGAMAIPIVRDHMFFWVAQTNPLAQKRILDPTDLRGQRLAILQFDDSDGDRDAMKRLLKDAGPEANVVFFDEMIEVFEEALAGRALGLTTRQHVKAIPVGSLTAVPYSALPLEHFLCYGSSRRITQTDDAFISFMRSHAKLYW